MKFPPIIAALALVLTLSPCRAADFREWLLSKAGKEASGEVLHFPFAFEETAKLESFLEESVCSGFGISLSGGSPPVDEVSDPNCRSIEFDGMGSGLVVNKWQRLTFDNQFSVGLWIKPEYSMFQESRGSRFIVSKSASNEAGFCITVTPDMGIRAGLVCGSGFAVASAPKVLEQHSWHHVGFSWDGETLQIYVDGKKAGDPVPAPAPYRDYKQGALTFGRPASLDTLNYRGNIGEFILSSEAYRPEGGDE